VAIQRLDVGMNRGDADAQPGGDLLLWE
jgi:hypothetical protein